MDMWSVQEELSRAQHANSAEQQAARQAAEEAREAAAAAQQEAERRQQEAEQRQQEAEWARDQARQQLQEQAKHIAVLESRQVPAHVINSTWASLEPHESFTLHARETVQHKEGVRMLQYICAPVVSRVWLAAG